MTYGNEFGKWLRMARAKLDIRQVQLAIDMKVSRATVVAWERGVATPKRGLVDKVRVWAEERGLPLPEGFPWEDGQNVKKGYPDDLIVPKVIRMQEAQNPERIHASQIRPIREVDPLTHLAEKELRRILKTIPREKILIFLEGCEHLSYEFQDGFEGSLIEDDPTL